jgi:predicted RNase H-like HicB family nuclease
MTALAGRTDSVAYTAVCEREGGSWVITVPELEAGGVTQARTLDEVPETVADLVAMMTGVEPADVEVEVRAHAGPGLEFRTSASRTAGSRLVIGLASLLARLGRRLDGSSAVERRLDELRAHVEALHKHLTSRSAKDRGDDASRGRKAG